MDGMSAILNLIGRDTIKTNGFRTGWMNDCKTQRTFHQEYPVHYEKHQSFFLHLHVCVIE